MSIDEWFKQIGFKKDFYSFGQEYWHRKIANKYVKVETTEFMEPRISKKYKWYACVQGISNEFGNTAKDVLAKVLFNFDTYLQKERQTLNKRIDEIADVINKSKA